MPNRTTMSGAVARRGLVVGLLLCVVAIAFEAIAVVTAMPKAAKDLGDMDLYAWSFSAFMIAQVFAIVASGRASDRFGPRLPLVIGFAVFALGLVISGSAPTMMVLILGRFVQGLGGGTMNLAVMVLVARLFEPKERPVLMTWMSVAWMMPAFVGPVIAAWLSTAFSWHWVFYSVLPVMAIGGALILGPLRRADLGPLLEEQRGEKTSRVPVLLAAAMVGAGAALIQIAGQHLVWWSLLWAALGLGLLLVGLPALLPRGYRLTGSGLAATVNVRMLSTGAFFGAETFLTLMLVERGGLDLPIAGLALTVGSVGWATGSWLQSRPWLRIRRDQIVIAGVAVAAAGLALVAVATRFPGLLLWMAVLGWVIGGLGMGMQIASTSLVVMELSPQAEIGRNTSSLQVGEALGNSLVAGIAGTIFAALLADSGQAFGWIYLAMVLISLLGLASSLRIGPVANHSIDNISTSR